MHDFAKANKHRWANMEINYMDCPITTGKIKTDTILVSEETVSSSMFLLYAIPACFALNR